MNNSKKVSEYITNGGSSKRCLLDGIRTENPEKNTRKNNAEKNAEKTVVANIMFLTFSS